VRQCQPCVGVSDVWEVLRLLTLDREHTPCLTRRRNLESGATVGPTQTPTTNQPTRQIVGGRAAWGTQTLLACCCTQSRWEHSRLRFASDPPRRMRHACVSGTHEVSRPPTPTHSRTQLQSLTLGADPRRGHMFTEALTGINACMLVYVNANSLLASAYAHEQGSSTPRLAGLQPS